MWEFERQSVRIKYPPLLPKHTSNEEKMNVSELMESCTTASSKKCGGSVPRAGIEGLSNQSASSARASPTNRVAALLPECS